MNCHARRNSLACAACLYLRETDRAAVQQLATLSEVGQCWAVKSLGLTVRLTTSFLFRDPSFHVVAKRRRRPLSPAVGLDCTIDFIAGERVGVRGTRLD